MASSIMVLNSESSPRQPAVLANSSQTSNMDHTTSTSNTSATNTTNTISSGSSGTTSLPSNHVTPINSSNRVYSPRQQIQTRQNYHSHITNRIASASNGNVSTGGGHYLMPTHHPLRPASASVVHARPSSAAILHSSNFGAHRNNSFHADRPTSGSVVSVVTSRHDERQQLNEDHRSFVSIQNLNLNISNESSNNNNNSNIPSHRLKFNGYKSGKFFHQQHHVNSTTSNTAPVTSGSESVTSHELSSSPASASVSSSSSSPSASPPTVNNTDNSSDASNQQRIPTESESNDLRGQSSFIGEPLSILKTKTFNNSESNEPTRMSGMISDFRYLSNNGVKQPEQQSTVPVIVPILDRSRTSLSQKAKKKVSFNETLVQVHLIPNINFLNVDKFKLESSRYSAALEDDCNSDVTFNETDKNASSSSNTGSSPSIMMVSSEESCEYKYMSAGPAERESSNIVPGPNDPVLNFMDSTSSHSAADAEVEISVSNSNNKGVTYSPSSSSSSSPSSLPSSPTSMQQEANEKKTQHHMTTSSDDDADPRDNGGLSLDKTGSSSSPSQIIEESDHLLASSGSSSSIYQPKSAHDAFKAHLTRLNLFSQPYMSSFSSQLNEHQNPNQNFLTVIGTNSLNYKLNGSNIITKRDVPASALVSRSYQRGSLTIPVNFMNYENNNNTTAVPASVSSSTTTAAAVAASSPASSASSSNLMRHPEFPISLTSHFGASSSRPPTNKSFSSSQRAMSAAVLNQNSSYNNRTNSTSDLNRISDFSLLANTNSTSNNSAVKPPPTTSMYSNNKLIFLKSSDANSTSSQNSGQSFSSFFNTRSHTFVNGASASHNNKNLTMSSINQLLALKDLNSYLDANTKMRPIKGMNGLGQAGSSNGVNHQITKISLRPSAVTFSANDTTESDFRRTNSALPVLRNNLNSLSSSSSSLIKANSYNKNGMNGSLGGVNNITYKLVTSSPVVKAKSFASSGRSGAGAAYGQQQPVTAAEKRIRGSSYDKTSL